MPKEVYYHHANLLVIPPLHQNLVIPVLRVPRVTPLAVRCCVEKPMGQAK